MPAFMVAAAARECGGVCEGDWDWDCDCDMVRVCCSRGATRVWWGVAEGEGEDGGSEFRSGGMAEGAENKGKKLRGRRAAVGRHSIPKARASCTIQLLDANSSVYAWTRGPAVDPYNYSARRLTLCAQRLCERSGQRDGSRLAGFAVRAALGLHRPNTWATRKPSFFCGNLLVATHMAPSWRRASVVQKWTRGRRRFIEYIALGCSDTTGAFSSTCTSSWQLLTMIVPRRFRSASTTSRKVAGGADGGVSPGNFNEASPQVLLHLSHSHEGSSPVTQGCLVDGSVERRGPKTLEPIDSSPAPAPTFVSSVAAFPKLSVSSRLKLDSNIFRHLKRRIDYTPRRAVINLNLKAVPRFAQSCPSQIHHRLVCLPIITRAKAMAPNDTFSTSRWRRNRSNANVPEQNPHPTPTSTIMNSLKPPPAMERKSSKMSLFNLFSKPKVERARGHTEAGLAIPMQPQEPPRPASPPKSSLRHNPPPQVQQVQRMRSSQFLRPMSMRPPSVKRSPGDDWDPPPLFQAYPQSIKYATVQTCLYSPDVLLRTHSQRRQAESMRERMDSHRDLATTLEDSPEHKKLEKTHRRLDSILNSTPQLTNKVYVLVTSGHMLQYSGDGPFDRLPERVLRLGKDSAAFASDLIPGKHWVLQILRSANEDGTVSDGPKHSLLSRLRIGGPIKREAASFLLVMESAEEMESWMTTVRKEIENLGGMKASSESTRGSSSIDETSERASAERPYPRGPVKRASSRLSMLAPIDSPLQSQYSYSPKIVTSDWETERKETRASVVDTASIQSSRQSIHRQSVEAPSITTSIVSNDQLQLDQLRERSRLSNVSTATSVSGACTRNTSRDPSPSPPSPIKEVPPPADAEPRRSETSLRSFHMHPGNSSSRRRSMQPLPVTNEDSTVSVQATRTPKRHSIYGPTSPTTNEPKKLESKLESGTPISSLTSFTDKPIVPASASVPTSNARTSVDSQTSTASSMRYTLRSSSAPPPRITTAIWPPPQAPLPAPPTARPQSTLIGSLSTAAAALSNPAERRISATPKPCLRPIPVRPQNPGSDGSTVTPRRASLANKPARLPLGVVVNRSVTEPVRPPSTASPASSRQSSPSRTVQAAFPSGQLLRRPTSVQINSDPAPFLSSARPNRAVSNTPSFVPGNRASSGPASNTLRQCPNIPVLRGYGQQLAPAKNITPRRSMPAMGLPPPAPPPNMPLPPPPPGGPPGVVAI
ncbi:hypothetical protein BU23DRAFT_604863 [Bimuria novae-zelandiae CBS 107.79]|uniref:PH domain-containing protein n=1 Tax=Bimuria novae-zelandiae CBS 107.79 TaxID=1447943 RepID=A0A6A5UKM9_9PLEO|nr:hypothetical protein BU23DRAFT_604863 [Bimuria novae-zelandiae CBS 107.79]